MMEYQEVIKNARGCIGPYCKACPVCNGAACRNTMPGTGCKRIGDLAMRNYQNGRKSALIWIRSANRKHWTQR